MAMINARRLLKMVKKWQQVAAIKRRRISTPKTDGAGGVMDGIAGKGHFVVYAQDGRRFVIPLHYLNCPILKKLLKMAEDEFGLMANMPITLPCDSIFIEYVVSMLTRNMPTDVENALLISITTTCSRSSSSSSLLHHGQNNKQALLIHGF